MNALLKFLVSMILLPWAMLSMLLVMTIIMALGGDEEMSKLVDWFVRALLLS